MFTFSGSMIGHAKAQISIMKKTGEKIRPLPFAKGNSVFITSDMDLVRAYDVVEVEGDMYYLGYKKQD